MNSIMDSTLPPDDVVDSLLKRTILPYLRSHRPENADPVVQTEEATLSVLLSVQEADLESHPSLLRIASLEDQVARGLKSINSLDSQADESAWTDAINHSKRINHLRMQKVTLDRTKNIIGNVAKCMRQAPSTCLEVGCRPQMPSRTVRRQKPWLSRKAIAETPSSPNTAGLTDLHRDSNTMRTLLEVITPNYPVPDEMELPVIKEENMRNYKLKITREQYREIGTLVQQTTAAIKNQGQQAPLWKRLQGVIESAEPENRLSARQEMPIFPRLGQKVRDQQIFKGMSDAVPDDLANLVTSIDCIPAAIDDDDVLTKIEDAITPLQSLLTPQRLHADRQQSLNHARRSRIEQQTLPSSPTPNPARPKVMEPMSPNWHPLAETAMGASSHRFPSYTTRRQDIPIAKRLDYQDKSDHLEVPSPLPLPSEFSVDIPDFSIPLDSSPLSDVFRNDVEEASSMIANNERMLIPGLVEKAKAALDLSQAAEDTYIPSIAPEDRAMRGTRFHINKMRGICDLASRQPMSLRRTLTELTGKNMHLGHAAGCQTLNLELSWRPVPEIGIAQDSPRLLQELSHLSTEVATIAPANADLWYWEIRPVSPPRSDDVQKSTPILKRTARHDGGSPSTPDYVAEGMMSNLTPLTKEQRTQGKQPPRKRVKREGLIELALGMDPEKRSTNVVPTFGRHIMPPTSLADQRVRLSEQSAHPAVPALRRGPRKELQNTSDWTELISRIEQNLDALCPLTCLCALSLLSDRTLCYGFARAQIKVAESTELEADLIISPKTAIIFQQVAALPFEVDRLAPYLGGLSDRFSRVVVVLILRPGARDPKEGSTCADPWSPSVIAAFQKLRQAVSRCKAISTSVDPLAASLDTEYEYVLSENALMSGCIVRVCANRDEQEYVQESGSEAGQSMSKDRDFLYEESYLIGTIAVGKHGLNSYIARMLGSCLGLDQLLSASFEDLFNTLWWMPARTLERLWIHIHPSEPGEEHGLENDVNEVRDIQPVLEVGGTAGSDLELVRATWGCTSPYASYSQTLVRAATFSDDFENAITPNTPQGYCDGRYF